jgi:hypothetical protein
MKHFLSHAGVFATNGTIHHGSGRLFRNATGNARRDRAIDDYKGGLVVPNIFHYLRDKSSIAKRKTNVHHVASVKRRGQIDIYAENVMPGLHDLKQRLPYFAKTDDNYRFAHLR